MMFLMNEIIKYWQKIPLYIANTVKIKNFIYLIGVISVVAGTYYKRRNYTWLTTQHHASRPASNHSPPDGRSFSRLGQVTYPGT